MKKLFAKDEVLFAVLWIIIYVVGFANADSISESIGLPKLITVVFGALMTAVLYLFVRMNSLSDYYGLCKSQGRAKNYGFYIPLLLMSGVNFWNGLTMNRAMTESLLYIVSMCFVGFLEELIFRGFLFKGMCKSNVKSAIIVSSLTFGVGHAVNLLLGAPLLDTLLQLMYASAIGFCFTALFYVGGSIIPCIISHAFINSTSIFAREPGAEMSIVIAIIQTLLGVSYGLWLLHRNKR